LTFPLADRCLWFVLLLVNALQLLDLASYVYNQRRRSVPNCHLPAGLRRSLVMSGSSEGDPEGGQGPGGVAGVLA
jgi:hypothetical protein